MQWQPPSTDKAYFLEGLRYLCDAFVVGNLYVAGRGQVDRSAEQGLVRIDDSTRLHLMIRGHHRISGHFDGHYHPVDLDEGDVFFYPTFTMGAEIWQTPCVYYGIGFRPELVRYLLVDYPGGPPPSRGTQWAINVPEGLPKPGQHLLEAVCAEAAEPHADGVVLREMIHLLLRLALRHLEGFEPATDSAVQSRHTWTTALEFLLTHYQEPIGRQEVARAVGIHPNYLSTLCRRHEGHAFHTVLESIRIARSRQLLETTQWKLREIARQCGYSSDAYFARAFKRSVGMTAGEYRRQARSK